MYGQREQKDRMARRPEKVTLTIPVELKRRARAKAILEGKNLSEVVRELLEKWVEKDPREEPEKED